MPQRQQCAGRGTHQRVANRLSVLCCCKSIVCAVLLQIDCLCCGPNPPNCEQAQQRVKIEGLMERFAPGVALRDAVTMKRAESTERAKVEKARQALPALQGIAPPSL